MVQSRHCLSGGILSKFNKIEPNYVAWNCPGCEESHAVPVHGFYVNEPERGWRWNGSLDSPTLTPSVLVNVGRSNPTAHLCHVYITDGQIMFLGDCTHKLAGQTVDIPDWENW